MTKSKPSALQRAEQLAALHEGIELMGTQAEVLLTAAFEDEVRVATGAYNYSVDRGEGVVAAKTVGRSIFVNQTGIGELGLQELRRLGAHEAGHVLLNDREEDLGQRQDLAMDEGHWNLLWVGGLALEEARIERQVARLGFPPADAVDYEHLGYRLYGLCEKAFLSVAVRGKSVAEMLSDTMTALDRITKTLAYIAAAQVEGSFEFDLRRLSRHAATNWEEFVAPTWERRLRLYARVPTCADILAGGAWDHAALEAASLERDTLRSIGFEFRGDGDSFEYWNILAESQWQERFNRLAEEAGRPAP